MKFITEPTVETKISKMKSRVRWQHPLILQKGIDQTRLEITDDHAQDSGFSFLVIGDSGTGNHRGDDPQRRVAEAMLAHEPDCRFMLHTGDVVYLVGSSEQYPENFIQPYREWLLGSGDPRTISYDQMVFKKPVLPVLGNHDYYDMPWWVSLASGVSSPLRKLLRSQLDLDVGWHGSYQGEAFAKAFFDYLQGIPEGQLATHLERNYTAKTDTGRCLCYRPGEFTRLPNRYYTFRYGGIDFFALDSNTFNQPLPIPDTAEGERYRQTLRDRRAALETERNELMMSATGMSANANPPQEADPLPDIYTEMEQLEEQIQDIDKQLAASDQVIVDFDQLDWFRNRLIHSWQSSEVRGRIVFFHHPPYVTEATKWHQGQTLAVRTNLRQVLQEVAQHVGDESQGRPLVDLVITGHAHCLEYLQTQDTGFADSHIHWLICGGSGFSLRRQRAEGPDLPEGKRDVVARSHLYLGRTGRGSRKKRPYSFVRIDVSPETPGKITLRPFVVEKAQGSWHSYATESIPIAL